MTPLFEHRNRKTLTSLVNKQDTKDDQGFVWVQLTTGWNVTEELPAAIEEYNSGKGSLGKYFVSMFAGNSFEAATEELSKSSAGVIRFDPAKNKIVSWFNTVGNMKYLAQEYRT